MSFIVFVLVVFAINSVFALASAFAASRWGRDPFPWFLFAAVAGPFGFLTLLGVHRDDRRRHFPTVRGAGPTKGGDSVFKVLIPVDGSDVSGRAVRFALDHFSGALDEADLLTVLPAERADALRFPSGSPRRRELEDEMAAAFGDLCEQMQQAGIACQTVTKFGSPADEIVKLQKEGNYDMIVMGRHGRAGVAKALLGSVSDRVVKSAECPVTVVS